MALREQVGYIRLPADREDYERALSILEDGMEGPGLQAAWEEGRRMPVQGALEYARRSRGPRRRPSFGWGSLTPTEVEVARLVAQGLTNPQIGEKLFVSARTVQTHLYRIFAKLGISARSELAAEVARRDAK